MGLALVAQGREELISAIEMGDAVEVLQVSICDRALIILCLGIGVLSKVR